MARQFPRFLFSNPINKKSKGPFVVHTLFPKAIFKIDILNTKKFFKLVLLDIDECTDVEKSDLLKRVSTWIKNSKETFLPH